MEREILRRKNIRNVGNNKATDGLGGYLKKSRINAGLSQWDVASAMGYSTPQFISNWERNVSQPPDDILEKLGKMYKLDVNEFMRKCYEREKQRAIDGVDFRFRKYLSKYGNA